MLAQTKQALFLKTKNIGDSIILTASISALPKDYRYVDIICFPESAPIFEMNKRVRNIFIIPRDKRGIKKIMAYISLFKKLFKEHYDMLAHFSNDWRGAILSRLLNPAIRVSRNAPRRGSFWHHSFNFLAPTLDHERPMAEQDVDLLRAANLYKKSIAPGYALNILQAQKNKIKVWLSHHKISLKNKLVVIHASSRWKFKEIPMTTWAKVIDELKSKKINVVVSGSLDDLSTNKLIYEYCQLKPVLTQNFSLKDTAALYSMADLVLTIDSMSTHLASAVKSPVISIFGPTNEKNWGPWKGKYQVIGLSAKDADTFACRPCGMDGCEGSKISQCLVQMDPKRIVREALEILR